MNRHRFPESRLGVTRRMKVAGAKFYVTVNKLPDGNVGEVFVKIAKNGSTVSGLMQALVTTISIALQYGVPWSALRDKYVGTRFEPRDEKYESLVDGLARTIDAIAEMPTSNGKAE
jgi:ribonucleoside-diphosphate reductase alpha chain